MSFHPPSGRWLRPLFLALAFAPPCALAQGLGLAEAQRIAVSRSQQLVAQEAAASATRQMQAAAGQLPDPVLRLGIQNVPLSGPERFTVGADFMTMRSVGVMQELTRPQKRRLRVERLQRDGERIEAERAEAVSTILRETALAWIDRRFAQASLDLLEQQVKEAQAEVEGARIEYSSGRGAQADFFAARSTAANLDDRLRQARRQLQTATIALARWVGPEDARRPPAGAVDASRLEGDARVEHQVARLPQLAVLEAQVRAAETEVSQAEADTKPDWTVEAMYSRRGAAYADMVSLGVSIPLQVDRANRQDRQVAAKLAAVAEARAKLEDTRRMLEAQLRTLEAEWAGNRERLHSLRDALLPAAAARREAALTAYRTGKGPLTAVLAARREEADAQLQVLTLEAETARLWAQLAFLVPQEKP